MQAIALEPPLTAASLVAALLTRGIICRGLPYANSVAFSPPLIISDGEIDELWRQCTRLSPTWLPSSEAGRSRGLLEQSASAERRESSSSTIGLRDLLSAGLPVEGSPKTASAVPTTISTAPIVNARW